MVDEERAFEVVHLVLDADGIHALSNLIDFLAIVIEVFHAAAGRALDLVEHVRHREAALFIGGEILSQRQYFRVHEIAGCGLFIRASKIHHDDALGHADLDRRKADAGGVVHGFQHVIHECAEFIRNAAFDGLGDFLQTRVRNGENFANSHGRKIGGGGREINAEALLAGVRP